MPDSQDTVHILDLSIRYFKNSYSYQFLQILSHIFSNTSKKYVVKRILTVLDLRGTPKYYMATLEEAPQPYFPAPGNFPPSQPSVSFPIGDQKWVVPVNADMVTKDGLTVTTTRERLIDAVNAARQQSQNVVDSYERHKANLELFDQIMREISPAYAGQAQRDEDMQKLREEVGQLRQMQAEFLSMKSSLDAFLKSQTPSKTSK